MKLKITKTVDINTVVTKKVTTLVITPWDTGSASVPKSIIQAKGELIVGTGSSAVTNLAAPAADKVLVGSPSSPTGLAWQDAAGGAVENSIYDFRMTVESGIPVSFTNQQAKSVVYMTPYMGNRISLYNGAWNKRTSSEISIKLTDTQTGTTTNSSKVITGLSDTTQLIVGMLLTGTNIGGAAVISSIDSPTQVTLSVNSTGNGSVAITFKVPANKNLDVFCFDNNGVPKLEFGPIWTGDNTRGVAVIVYQDGVLVKSGDATRRYLGTVRTVADGQTETSQYRRYVWNKYNKVPSRLYNAESTVHTYATTAWRAWNNSTASAQCAIVQGFGEEPIVGTLNISATYAGGLYTGMAWDGSSPVGVANVCSLVASTSVWTTTEIFSPLGAGFHYVCPWEYGNASVPTLNVAYLLLDFWC
jgi:hypothetical protein